MKVFCVRIGDKYGPEYEDYINEKLSMYDVHWIREPFDSRVELQWNKMNVMSLDIDEPVVVLDIDILLVNDYQKLFEHPVKDNHVLAIPAWWGSTLPINGGFWKYIPSQMNSVFEHFMSDVHYWQSHYIMTGQTRGPCNGEQNFVYEHCNMQTLPKSWVGRMVSEWYINAFDNYDRWWKETNLAYIKETGNEYYYMDDEFHPDVKLVHFTTPSNKPHEWSRYDVHK